MQTMNNNKNIMLALRASNDRDGDVIAALEDLGGVDRNYLVDWHFRDGDVLFVRSSGLIDYASEEAFLREFGEACILSLEEFEEACPFAVGDAVKYRGDTYRVSKIMWVDSRGQFLYKIVGEAMCVLPSQLKALGDE